VRQKVLACVTSFLLVACLTAVATHTRAAAGVVTGDISTGLIGGYEQLDNSPQHTTYVMTAAAFFSLGDDSSGKPVYTPLQGVTLDFAVEGESGIWYQLCTAVTNSDGVAACSGRVYSHIVVNGVVPNPLTAPDEETMGAWSVVYPGSSLLQSSSDYGRVQGTPTPAPTPPDDGQQTITVAPDYTAGCQQPDPSAPATLGSLITDGGNCNIEEIESILTGVVFSIATGFVTLGSTDVLTGVIAGADAAAAAGDLAADAAELAEALGQIADAAAEEGGEEAADASSQAAAAATRADQLAASAARAQSALYTSVGKGAVIGSLALAGGTTSALGEVYGNNPVTVDPQQTLEIGAGTTLTNNSIIYNQGTLGDDNVDGNGAGTIDNDGVIVNDGTIPGAGSGDGSLLITGNNYTLDFATGAGTAEPPMQVLAPSVAAASLSLPAPTPPAGETFAGWVDSTYDPATDGYDPVTDSTNLRDEFGAGPVTETLTAVYVPQEVTVGVTTATAAECNLTVLTCDSLPAALGLISANPSYFDGHDVTLAIDKGTYGGADIDASALSSLTLESIYGDGVSSTSLSSDQSGPVLTVTAGDVTVKGLTITGGSAGTASGGGVDVTGGTVTLSGDDIGGDTATGGLGGGVYDQNATVVMTGDTLEHDAAEGGAGVAVVDGSLTLDNDTFTDDAATGSGGAVLDYSSSNVTMENDTLAGNTAGTGGNGIAANGPGADVGVANSILDDGAECTLGSGNPTITDLGYNVESDDSCGLGATSEVGNSAINLTPLVPLHGVQPPVLALGEYSSAMQEVPLSGKAAPGTLGCTLSIDESGQPEPTEASLACDAGAVQSGYYPPSPPPIVNVVAGDGEATVTDDPPASSGGLPLQGSAIIADDLTNPANGGQHCSPDGLLIQSSCTVTGLTNGDSYTFSAVETNTVDEGLDYSGVDPITGAFISASATVGGVSEPSPASLPVTPLAAPGAPSGVVATGGDAQATVTWTDPATSDGSPVDGYGVTATDTTNVGNGGQACTAPPGATSCTLTGLTDGDSYSFVVSASNAAGTTFSPVSNPLIPGTAPVAAAITSVLAGPASATVTWSAPADGGSPITSYLVTAADQTIPGNGGETCTPVPATATTCTVTGLTPGDSYTFTVTATNQIGTGPPSQSSSAITAQLSTPTPPSVTDLPLSPSYGGSFVASVSTSGDGVLSVSSSTPTVCTVGSDGLTVSFVGTGPCTLTASVGQGTLYQSATGQPQTLTVGPGAPPPPTITGLPTSATFGGSFVAAVSTVGGDAGSVSSASPAVCTVGSDGLTVSFVGVGNCFLVPSEAAGPDYDAATGQQVSIPVQAAATATSASSASVPYSSGAPSVGLSASVSSAGGTVGEGSIIFTLVGSSGQTVGSSVTAAVSGGAASADYVLPAGTVAGSYGIVASYDDPSGDFAASVDRTQALTVTAAPVRVAIQAPAPVDHSDTTQPVSVSASVSSGGQAVTEGSVTFSLLNAAQKAVGTAVSAPVVAGVAATSYLLPANLRAGSYRLETVYADPSGDYARTTGSTPLVVVRVPMITSASSTTFVVGRARTFKVRRAGFEPGKPVTFAEAGPLPAGVRFDTGSGTLTGTARTGSEGDYPLVLQVSGGGATVTQRFVLHVRATTAVHIGFSAARPVTGQALAATASVSPGDGGGTFSFSESSAGGPAVAVAGCQQVPNTATGARCDLPVPTEAGRYRVVVRFAGDLTYLPATKGRSFTVKATPSVARGRTFPLRAVG
jgi:hypothetical protein